jgi:hypothetical protein
MRRSPLLSTASPVGLLKYAVEIGAASPKYAGVLIADKGSRVFIICQTALVAVSVK